MAQTIGADTDSSAAHRARLRQASRLVEHSDGLSRSQLQIIQAQDILRRSVPDGDDHIASDTEPMG